MSLYLLFIPNKKKTERTQSGEKREGYPIQHILVKTVMILTKTQKNRKNWTILDNIAVTIERNEMKWLNIFRHLTGNLTVNIELNHSQNATMK